VDVTWEQMVFAEATTVVPLIASDACTAVVEGAHKAAVGEAVPILPSA
jgi:hypothetical protein